VTAGINEEANFYPKEPLLIIQTIPITPLPEEYYTHGVFVITTTQERIFPTLKTTSYLAAGVALQEAMAKKAADAIYLNKKGELLELTRSNLFAVKQGVLLTPKEDILYGITRKVVLEIANSLEIPVREEPLLLSDVENWDEAFHSSSVKELVPIVKIDEMRIGKGTVGPMTTLLRERFAEATASVTVEAL
jgi:branched-subunit amino acid aminotransferase/4-amino-4-deoxychorismate lyase